MHLFLSVLAVLIAMAAWVALLAHARAVLIILIASTGPVIALWSVFFRAEWRRLGKPMLSGWLGSRSTVGRRKAAIIGALSVTVGVLGPIVGLTGIWHERLAESTVLLLFVIISTPWSVLNLLCSLSLTARPAGRQLTDEMMEQLKGKAAFRTLIFQNILLMACIVVTGMARCSTEITLTAFYALFMAGIVFFVFSYNWEWRRMGA